VNDGSNKRWPVNPRVALQALRHRRGWSLEEVSLRTGLPVASLVKVESGQLTLTPDRWLRVSMALETDLADLLALPGSPLTQAVVVGRRSITRAGRAEIMNSPMGQYQYLASELLRKQSLPSLINVTARSLQEFGAFERHPGEELVYVIEGEIELHTDLYLPVHLQKGDSMYFDSNMGHGCVAVGRGPCRILSICIAPESQLSTLIEQRHAAGVSPARRCRPA
jgi:mannose-6-phosphate isomerase-like protein (cupin superfamily)